VKSIILLVFISIIAVSCSSIREYKLSKFDFNNKSHNSLILNRIPDYGDGHLDGCIVMSEMHLSLKREVKDSIVGVVKDTKTNEPVIAEIKIYFKDLEQPITLTNNGSGTFSFTKIKEIDMVSIWSIGYRRLVIDLKRFNQL
jgi:hypothetical protein